MGLISFIKTAGRKVGLFGGSEAAAAEDAEAEAKIAAAQAAADIDAAQAQAQRDAIFSRQLLAAVRAKGLDIDGISVQFTGETAVLTGTASSTADAEKAALIVGNHEGVGQVDLQIEVVVPEPPSVYHTVVSGDSLSKISLAVYGVIHLYDQIFEANRPMLEDPNEIFPGQVLRCPPVSAPVHTVKAGDTLGGIAKHWYGKAGRYTDIFEANRGVLSTPDVVEVGQMLTIPLSATAPRVA